MGHEAKKTEHSGSKKGRGAYWGPRQDAKKESDRLRRENDKRSVEEQLNEDGASAYYGEIILYESGDGSSGIDVRFKDETVWLTLNQMAELFGRDNSVISRHLRNIFQTGELSREATVAKNATGVDPFDPHFGEPRTGQR